MTIALDAYLVFLSNGEPFSLFFAGPVCSDCFYHFFFLFAFISPLEPHFFSSSFSFFFFLFLSGLRHSRKRF